MGLNPNGIVTSICTDNFGNLYAARLFTDSVDATTGNASGDMYVAIWNGTTWSMLGNTAIQHLNPIGILSLICDETGNVYAGGAIGDSFGYNVFKFNGTSWGELGGPHNLLHGNGWIWSLCTDKYGNVYAAGDFTDSTTIAQSNEYVAKWDGTSWSELGSGSGRLQPNGRIASIASDSYGNIYACGDLVTDAGEGFVGMYPNAATSVQQITHTDDVNVFPNPAHNTITIRINETKQSYAGTNYSLYDCTGWVYVSGKIDNSNTPVDISALPTGIYILQLDNNVNATFKLVKQ